VPLVGDFAAAEDLVQDAVEAALTRWPVDGIPDRPDAWLFTVARRRGLDVLRREIRHRDRPREVGAGPFRAGRGGLVRPVRRNAAMQWLLLRRGVAVDDPSI
jgi:DNA-directed RNA polymerase specialized sigma24 family protein